MRFRTIEMEGEAEPVPPLAGINLMAVAIDGRAHLVPEDFFSLFCIPIEDEEPTPEPETMKTQEEISPKPADKRHSRRPHPNSQIGIQKRVRRCPASDTMAAMILRKLEDGVKLSTNQIIASLSEQDPDSIRSAIQRLRIEGWIGSDGSEGRQTIWGRR